jgi:hypothetical protein
MSAATSATRTHKPTVNVGKTRLTTIHRSQSAQPAARSKRRERRAMVAILLLSEVRPRNHPERKRIRRTNFRKSENMNATTIERRPVVFVTQQPMKRDPETKAMAPTINIGPAGKHGDLRVMTPMGAQYYETPDLMDALRPQLQEYDFERGDSILSLGDPAIIAAVGFILGRTRDAFRILKWDRLGQAYNVVEIRP